MVVGSPGALNGALLASVRVATRGFTGATLLVAGVLMRPYLERRLAAESPLLNVRVETSGELGRRLWGMRTQGAAGTTLGPALERQFAFDATRASSYLAEVAQMPGITDAAVRLLRELRQEGIGTAEFAEQARRPGMLESPEKAEGLIALCDRFDSLSAGHVSGAEALAQADPADFDGRALVVYGVRQLGASARRLVKGIADRGIPVTVLLPTLSPEADVAHEPLLQWLEGECGAQVTRLDAPAVGTSALAQLRARLFDAGEPVKPDAAGTVRVVSAPSHEMEAREAVRACLRWAEAGVPFRDMAIVAKDLAGYQPLLEGALREAGIPFYAHGGTPLPVTPVGRQISRLLDLLQADVPRRELMAFLAEECTPPETLAPYGTVAPWKWDRYSRRAGVVAGIDQWTTNLTAGINADEAEVAAGTAYQWVPKTIGDRRVLLRFVQAFSAEVAAMRVPRSLAGHITALRGFVDRWVVGGGSHLQAIDDLLAIDDAVGGQVDVDQFIDIVRELVGSSFRRDPGNVAPGQFMRRGVNILDASQMPHLSFSAVCVVGVNEGVFPSAPRQDPLLLDDERARLNDAAGWTLPLRTGGADPQPMQFGLMVHGARQFLQVSYARAQRAGERETLPSQFLCQVLSALTGERVTAEGVRDLRGSTWLTWVSSGRVGPAERDLALSAAEWDRALLQDRVEVGRALLEAGEPRALRGRQAVAARAVPDTLTPYDGLIVDPAALQVAAGHFERKMSSPTRIADYAKCPRKFFLSHVVGSRVEDEPEDIVEMEVSTRGTIIHGVLEDVLAQVPPGDITMSNRDHLVGVVAELTEKRFDEQVARGRAGRAGLHDRTLHDLVDECIAWLDEMLRTEAFDDEDRFHLEVRFPGPALDSTRPAPLGPLVIGTPHGEVRLSGRIDRLTEHADGTFSVVDYKTGRVLDLEPGAIGDGQDLQLPLYMLASAQALGVDLGKGEASYEFVSRRAGYVRITMTGNDLIRQQERFDQVMNGITAGVAGGDFHAEPGDGSCRYCDFKMLCGPARGDEAALKQGDAHVARFRREVRGEVGGAP